MDLSSLTGMFVGLHAILAMQTNTPELMISEQEGKDFTKAAQNVMRHYSVQTTQKTLDWLAFAGVSVGMYGTRIVAINARKKSEAAGRSERGEVIRFPDRGRRPSNPPPQSAEVDPGTIDWSQVGPGAEPEGGF